MEMILKAAFERDVDMVLVRAFCEQNAVTRLFLQEGDCIVEVQHSAMELHGESDLQVIVERNAQRHAILIEDKVDAQAQPDQYQRYCERGARGVAEGRWAGYTVYIAAPQKYLESDREARKYPNKVSYEDIRDLLTEDKVSLAIIETALKKSEGMLPSVVDEAVTAFWDAYYNYHQEQMPHLLLHVNRGKKGPNATWPDFRTVLSDTKILHKSERGVVDLQFRGMAEKISSLQKVVAPYMDADMWVEKAGNSAVIRLRVPVMDFSKEFNSYIEEIKIVFSAIDRLNRLALVLAEHQQSSIVEQLLQKD